MIREDAALRSAADAYSVAVDASWWAVTLGVSGLLPHNAEFTTGDDDQPVVRLMFAFARDVPTAVRDRLATDAMARLIGPGADPK